MEGRQKEHRHRKVNVWEEILKGDRRDTNIGRLMYGKEHGREREGV